MVWCYEEGYKEEANEADWPLALVREVFVAPLSMGSYLEDVGPPMRELFCLLALAPEDPLPPAIFVPPRPFIDWVFLLLEALF